MMELVTSSNAFEVFYPKILRIMGTLMAYYDSIANRWHETTGPQGGAFKELVLNDILLKKLPKINNRSILELGAGNGYFLPSVLRRFPGQVPSKLVVTDQSGKLLEIAKRHFKILNAEYRLLDICKPFPFETSQFNLIIASMVFNEVSSPGFRNALKECHRLLSSDGLLLISITHPDFINNLQKSGLLKRTGEGVLTMPGSGNLRLPVVIRSLESYGSYLRKAGFVFEEEEGYPTLEVLRVKTGLRNAWKVPVALVYTCTKAN